MDPEGPWEDPEVLAAPLFQGPSGRCLGAFGSHKGDLKQGPKNDSILKGVFSKADALLKCRSKTKPFSSNSKCFLRSFEQSFKHLQDLL